MLHVAGTPLLPLAGVGIGGGIVATGLALGASYRRARVLAFLNPWADPLNTGYQNIQSLVGIASGGLTGVGLGESRAKWGFLPYAHTDFIFAIIAEELGLIGAFVVVALFAALGVLGAKAAQQAPDRFGMLLAVGGHGVVRRAGLRQHRGGHRHPAHHRRPAAVPVLRRVLARVQHDRGGPAAERGPPGPGARPRPASPAPAARPELRGRPGRGRSTAPSAR